MIREPPEVTLTDTLLPYTTRIRSHSNNRPFAVTLGGQVKAGSRATCCSMGVAKRGGASSASSPGNLHSTRTSASWLAVFFWVEYTIAAKIGRASCRERVCQYV